MSYKKAQKIYADVINEIKESGLYKDEYIITSPQGGEISVQFPQGSINKNVLNFCSNNYLGLASHKDVIAAAKNGLDNYGFGLSSVRFICGTQDLHKKLEEQVSSFLGKEDTILFSSCFDANAAIFEVLLNEEDAIFSDQLVHASIIDGERLAKKVERLIYPHSDMVELEKMLANSNSRIKMIVTDGVFSMDGDMAKLDEIVTLAEKYEALVFVDDSHATGLIGNTGRGTPEYFNVIDKVDIISTTFGKALGGANGGCISGKKEIISLLRQRARPYLFSNTLMPAVVSATIKVLEIIDKDFTLKEKLIRMSEYWRASLINLGFDIKNGNTPIIPVMLYDAKLAQDFARELFNEGVYVRGFFYPVVAQGQARIRTQISASLTEEDLEKALFAFKKVGIKLGVIK
ncbi:TPA: glycine C-acetyltransferase [Candidatus Nomurabacteria bacterium]|nr:glycine C-acetyltransferase [Candidatus Nomurabacteria bacterium]